jgi:hypothetical protein
MSEEAAHRTAKTLALGMGITFYVARSSQGRFLAVQIPSDDCEILASRACSNSSKLIRSNTPPSRQP